MKIEMCFTFKEFIVWWEVSGKDERIKKGAVAHNHIGKPSEAYALDVSSINGCRKLKKSAAALS